MNDYRKQRGDTIIEVLFSVVIIGLALGAAFTLANRSLNIGRAAQERTEALKIAESRIELLKIAYSQDLQITGSGNSISQAAAIFCVYYDAVGIQATSVTSNINCSQVQPNNGVSYAVVVQPRKRVELVGSAAGGGGNVVIQYDVTVEWDRISGLSAEKDKLTMYYRP